MDLMGAILLAFGLGSLLMTPLSGMLAVRYGCRRVFTLALMLVLAALPALATLHSAIPLALTLFLFGVGIGAMDEVVTIHVVVIEKYAQQPIMSGFHAIFSLGGIAGAAAVSTLLAWGLSPLHVVMIIVLILALIMLFVDLDLWMTQNTVKRPFLCCRRVPSFYWGCSAA